MREIRSPTPNLTTLPPIESPSHSPTQNDTIQDLPSKDSQVNSLPPIKRKSSTSTVLNPRALSNQNGNKLPLHNSRSNTQSKKDMSKKRMYGNANKTNIKKGKSPYKAQTMLPPNHTEEDSPTSQSCKASCKGSEDSPSKAKYNLSKASQKPAYKQQNKPSQVTKGKPITKSKKIDKQATITPAVSTKQENQVVEAKGSQTPASVGGGMQSGVATPSGVQPQIKSATSSERHNKNTDENESSLKLSEGEEGQIGSVKVEEADDDSKSSSVSCIKPRSPSETQVS